MKNRNEGNRYVKPKNYENPPVLDGYRYLYGEWNNGYTIVSIKGNLCTWIPLGYVYDDEEIYEKCFPKESVIGNQSADLKKEWLEKEESLRKYGGFYISSCTISPNAQGEPQSIEGAYPWIHIDVKKAHQLALSFEKNENIKTDLPFEGEYKFIFDWFKKTKSIDWERRNTSKRRYMPMHKKLKETGSDEKMRINNICDFVTNVGELVIPNTVLPWTAYVEGCYDDKSGRYYVDYDWVELMPECLLKSNIGFRVTLYAKP